MITRDDLEADRAHYRELYDKAIADANALKGCIQYIELKLSESRPADTETEAGHGA